MWILTAWQCISPEVIPKGFKKCSISSAVEGTENDKLWNEDGDVRSGCEEDEGTDCEDGESDTDWYRSIRSNMLCVFSA
jgi:hypothetical protein